MNWFRRNLNWKLADLYPNIEVSCIFSLIPETNYGKQE